MGVSEQRRILDPNTPLITTDSLLLVCKEIDSDTPVEEIESFVISAHTMVCNVLDGYGVSLSALKMIETYLGAHFATLTYPSVRREGVGPLTTAYFGKVETGLTHTRYGQMAMSLDPTGRLMKLSEGEGLKEVKMRSLGGISRV